MCNYYIFVCEHKCGFPLFRLAVLPVTLFHCPNQLPCPTIFEREVNGCVMQLDE